MAEKTNVSSIANLRLIPESMEKVSTEGKLWLAKAIVSMLIVDKHLDTEEMGYFQDAIMLVEDETERDKLINAVKTREAIPLDNLGTDREFAGHFFYYLAMIVAADGKVKTSEVNLLMLICGKLGFAPRSAKDVLRWATDLVKLNNERTQMIEGLRHVSAVFS